MKKSMHFVRTFIGAISGTFLSIILVSASPESICPVPTAYSIRSQGQDEAREQAGLTGHTNIPSNHEQYGTLALTPALNRSFSPGHIAVPLFGRDLQTGSIIGISGSKATTRNPKDWLADYYDQRDSYHEYRVSGNRSLVNRSQIRVKLNQLL